MARKDFTKTAAANLKAHKAVEAAATTTEALPECRHCHTPLDTAAQAQGSKGRDGGWTCGPCIKLAASAATTPKPKVEPTVGIVPLAEQLTDTEQKQKGKPTKTEAPLSVVEVKASQVGEVDAKRQKMIETLARARAIRAQQLKDGTLVAPVKSAKPVKVAAPAPTPVSVPPAQPVDIDRLEALCARMEAVADRLERLEKVAVA